MKHLIYFSLNKKGYLKYKGDYIYGKKEGIWTEYKRNGKIKNEILYKDGKEVKNKGINDK